MKPKRMATKEELAELAIVVNPNETSWELDFDTMYDDDDDEDEELEVG